MQQQKNQSNKTRKLGERNPTPPWGFFFAGQIHRQAIFVPGRNRVTPKFKQNRTYP